MAIRTGLECFENWIGVAPDCGSGVSNSGLWITNLPGLTLKVAADVNDEFTSGLKFLEDLRDRTTEEMVDEFNGVVAEYVTLMPIVANHSIGEFRNKNDGDDYLAVSAENRGVEICLYKASPLLRMQVESVDFYCNDTVAGKVFTILDGDTSTAYTVDTVAGQIVNKPVNQDIRTDKLWVYWNTSDVRVNDSHFKQGSCKNCRSKGYRSYKYIRARGKDDSNDNHDETFGLSINLNVVCSWEKLACNLRAQMSRILWYKCGINFAEEALMNDRYNRVTTLRADDWKRQLDPDEPNSWMAKYMTQKKLFSRALEKVLKQSGGDCITCHTSKIKVLRT